MHVLTTTYTKKVELKSCISAKRRAMDVAVDLSSLKTWSLVNILESSIYTLLW